MQRRMMILALSLGLLALMAVGVVSAQEDSDLSDNACAVGGELDGVCETAQDFICGAELFRYRQVSDSDFSYAIPGFCRDLIEDNEILDTHFENDCYSGGAMAGRCEDSEWSWTCGWYLARWGALGGYNGDFEFPDFCEPEILLPPPSIENGGLTGTGGPGVSVACFSVSFEGDDSSMRITLPPTVGNAEIFFDVPGCSGEPSWSFTAVDASSETDALSKCESLGFSEAYSLPGSPGLYECWNDIDFDIEPL